MLPFRPGNRVSDRNVTYGQSRCAMGPATTPAIPLAVHSDGAEATPHSPDIQIQIQEAVWSYLIL